MSNPRLVAAEVTRLSFVRRFSLLTSAATFLLVVAAFGQTVPPAAPTINPDLPSLFIAGDSTAARGRGEIQQGWGVPLADYFDATKVNVVNRARGGRSSRTFITEGSWDKLVAELKKGDIVLIQFGENDGSKVAEEATAPRNTWRFRGSLPGLGDETREIENLLTEKHEVVHTYGWYMRKMVEDVKAKAATPVVVSIGVRNRWLDGRIERGSGRYAVWAFEVAKQEKVPFLDITNHIADKFEQLGQEKTKAIYQQDFVHYNAEGADIHAQQIVAGLKGLRPSPVTNFLSAKGQAVTADRWAWLRLPSARDPKLPSIFLVGDSTVRQGRGDGADGGQWGWGEYLPRHVDTDKVNVVNRAVGGTGAKSFQDAGYWDYVVQRLKPGDVVLIQFGHNDNGPAAPLKGIGDEVEERENPRTKEKGPMHTWGFYMRKYIDDAKAKGATPVVCSLIPRKIWQDGKIKRPTAVQADWARDVAQATGVAFVDLHELIAQRYDALGAEKVEAMFATNERVHTSAAGAELNAECVIAGLKALPQDPVAAYLKP